MKPSAAERTMQLFAKKKKPKPALSLEEREQARRRGIALRVEIPAMPEGNVDVKRSEPPKGGPP